MVHVSLRLDLTANVTRELIEYYLADKYPSYSYVYEVGKNDNNPHCHIWFEMLHENLQALRMSIKKIFCPSKGEYSLKNLVYTNDEEWREGYPLRYFAYLFKEGTCPVFHNVDSEVIDAAEVLSKSVKDDYDKRRRERRSINDVVNEKLDVIMVSYPDFDHCHLVPIMRNLIYSFVDAGEDVPRAYQLDNAFVQYMSRKSKVFCALYAERRIEAILGRPSK